MPTPTLEPIATTTLASAAASITFGSIPNTYTDLRIVFSGRTTNDNYQGFLRFNNDSGGYYSFTDLYGNGSSAVSARSINQGQIIFAGTMSATYPNLCTIDVTCYTASINKTVLLAESDDRNGSGNVRRKVGLWRNTGAITRVDLIANVNTFQAGTTATLYGIKAA